MPPASTNTAPQLRGQVVSSFGRRSLVETTDGRLIACVSRGRRSGIVCGDRVLITLTGSDEGVIEATEPRRSLLYRSDSKREKAIAANVTQVVVVLAVAPSPNTEFVDRCIVAAEHAGIRTLLVLNKLDLSDPQQQASKMTDRYTALGYPTVRTSKQTCVDQVRQHLESHVSVFIGASGVGKSTLINRLIPQARAKVGELSAATESGRHTTTRGELYRIDSHTALIDSPGMHAFGLSHIGAAELAQAFVEFRPMIGECRFSNCRHDGEPDCAVEAAVRDGRISRERQLSYRRILGSLT